MQKEIKLLIIITISLVVFVLALITCCYLISPPYNVWAQRKEGEAELAKAESNRMIKTLEAKAAEESAKHLAQAEIIRAHGVAEANKIIGQSLTNNEAYLRYLWIHNLESTKNQIIYVPTEGSLPVLEAGKR